MGSSRDRVCPVCGWRNTNPERCTFCGTSLMGNDPAQWQGERSDLLASAGTPSSRQTLEGGSHDPFSPLPDHPPEGPRLRPRYAGFWIRSVAYSIDSLLITLLAAILLSVGIFGYLSGSNTDLFQELPSLLPSMRWGWVNLTGFALTMGYFTYFLGSRGQTPGKMICGLKVIRLDGTPIGYGQAALRTLGYYLNHLTLGIGFLWVAFDPKKQGFHDKIAGTCEIQLGLAEVRDWEFPPRSNRQAG